MTVDKMKILSGKTIQYIKKQDEILNKKAGWATNNIKLYVSNLFEFGRVEVGYRSCCGSTDMTQKTYASWIKVLKKIRADGVEVLDEPQKHDNAYATNNDGFWNSNIYTINAS